MWAAETTPAPDTGWQIGALYNVGDTVTYDGKTYRCLVRHVAQPDWTPTAVLSRLWELVITTPVWAPGVRYIGDNTAGAGKGDVVLYGGRRYRCWQTHTSQVGWEPPRVPALWIDLGPA
ncbi:MAG: hypothetical protein KatS3mg051_1938 [Anaerolineae bacterium]|nr:MAG: hypothetical protein KatS3mg051_1938 [Anaerolineae bacterium]